MGEECAADIKVDAIATAGATPASLRPAAKRVIYLHLTGSPPNLDIYDYKPELVKRDGQDCPQEFLEGSHVRVHFRHAEVDGHAAHVCPVRRSRAPGLSDAVPNFHAPDVADEMCFIHSMNTDQFNHAPAELLIYTGSPRPGRPSMGAWVTYGLGTENQNLPGFVVLICSGVQPNGGSQLLRQRFSAVGLSRRAMPLQGRPGALCFRSRGHGSRLTPPFARYAAGTQRIAGRTNWGIRKR